MLFDSDILIYYLRGNVKAAKAIDRSEQRYLSIVSYMELLQGARNKTEVKTIKAFLADTGFTCIPLTENIGHRASIYMEEYGLQVAICMADALIAATATENQLVLFTGNRKHYQPVNDLQLKIFRP